MHSRDMQPCWILSNLELSGILPFANDEGSIGTTGSRRLPGLELDDEAHGVHDISIESAWLEAKIPAAHLDAEWRTRS